jgi:predicted nucleotidyltransferase
MNTIVRRLQHVSDTLIRDHRRWALIGGLAVSCHVDPRFTRDIDVAVAVDDDADAERLVASLVADGYRAVQAVEQEAVGRLATVRLEAFDLPDEDVVVDLMFASCGIEAEICSGAVTLEVLPGLSVPVASRGHLMAMKLLSVDDTRLQDALDLRALLHTAAPEDLAVTTDAIRLIAERGYHRGRDLEALLGRYRAKPS